MFNKYQKVYRNLAVIEIRRAHYSFWFLTVLLSFGLLRGNHDCSRHNVGHICWSPCIKCASVKLMLLITLQLCCSRWFQPLTDQWRGTDSALSDLPTRLSSLKKKSTCGPWIRSTEKPSPKYCLLLCVQNVSGGHGLSQWCNQDSFDASSTRIRIFVKTDIFPVICQTLKPCLS